MSLSTFAELKASLADWVPRVDFSTGSLLDDVVRMAELDITNGCSDPASGMMIPPLRCRSMETHVSAFALSGELTALPSGFLEAKEIYLNGATRYEPLQLVSPSAFETLTRNVLYSGNQASEPSYYCVVGSNLRVGPAASGTSTVALTYYAEIPALSVSNTTNWLLAASPACYLYGSLRHLAAYSGDDAKLGVWQAAFATSLKGLAAAQRQSSAGGSARRSRLTGASTP